MTDTPQEAWNMATATMKRLDNILSLCSFHAQQNELVPWFNCIMDLRRNLYPFLSDEEIEGVENKLNSLPPGWKNGMKVRPMCYDRVNMTLDKIYIILYSCMKNKGLLLPKADDVTKAIIEM